MATVLVSARNDLLSAWARDTTAASRPRGFSTSKRHGGIRFAFYGRLSTVEYQDPASSQRWQRDNAVDLIDGRGVIVAEFFDVGCSRSVPWALRPQARRLLEMLARPDRGFAAIVVGEYERAFAGGQLHGLLPLLERFGVELWLPEAGGAVDQSDPAHQALLMLLGYQSRREVLRSRFRTAAAMRVQARDQGRLWVVGRRTGTASLTPVRTPTARTRGGGGGCTVWTPTLSRHRMCGGSSRSGWLARVRPGLPAR
jgi:site-specific DNA recombinase